jgi:phage gpG-like protein
MIELNIELRDEELQKLLAKLQDHNVLLSGIAQYSGPRILQISQEALDKQRSPNGREWVWLKDATFLAKLRKYGTIKPKLEADRTLKDSLKAEFDGKVSIVSLNAISEEGYSYPLAHQFGAPKANIPARPFLPINETGDDLMDIAKERIRNLAMDAIRSLL